VRYAPEGKGEGGRERLPLSPSPLLPARERPLYSPVTNTCCARMFMCAQCATCGMRCPLCTSIEFMCLCDEL
jgi:hypothetical protein